MQLFTLLIFGIAVNLGSCANYNSRESKSDDSDLQRKALECDLENNELRKDNAELRIQIDKLLLKLLEMRGKEKEFSRPKEVDPLNCSGLATHIGGVSESLKNLSEDVKSFGQLIDKQVKGNEDKTTKENTCSTYIPKVCAPLPHDDEELFRVACDAMSSNGEWIVIQRRMDGKTNFYRPWADYRRGFGNVTGEYFLGLENLHIVTLSRAYELLIEMVDFENEKRHAKYDLIVIGNENEKYALKELGTYSGDAGDSLRVHKSQKFSTHDQDNDDASGNCAKSFKGAWWFENCLTSNLNGEYEINKRGEGMYWSSFHNEKYSLKFVEMKIRPKA